MGFLRGLLYVTRNKIIDRQMEKAIQLKNQERVKIKDIVSIATSLHLYLQDRTNAARSGQMMDVGKYDPMEISEVQQILGALAMMYEDEEYLPEEFKFMLEQINPNKLER